MTRTAAIDKARDRLRMVGKPKATVSREQDLQVYRRKRRAQMMRELCERNKVVGEKSAKSGRMNLVLTVPCWIRTVILIAVMMKVTRRGGQSNVPIRKKAGRRQGKEIGTTPIQSICYPKEARAVAWRGKSDKS